MPSPRVSVLMAVHEGEVHLDEAIQSILNQTFSDFEFTIINDGSTDGTASIIERYRQEDDRIRVYEQPNFGLVVSLNRGVELACGEYVARMDADDISMPGRLAAQVAFMDAHPEVGICGTWIELIGTSHKRVKRYPTDDASIRSWLLFESVLAHPSIVLRRELFKKTGLFYDATYDHAEDYALWMRAARHMALANIPEVLLRYRRHPQQVSQSRKTEQNASARLVRLAQLECLGIQPTKNELSLHQALSTLQFQPTREFIGASLKWLNKLKDANEVADIYPEPIFSHVLGQRWSAVCNKATYLGLWTLKIFRSTPLCTCAGLSWKQLIKFSVKCWIGHIKSLG